MTIDVMSPRKKLAAFRAARLWADGHIGIPASPRTVRCMWDPVRKRRAKQGSRDHGPNRAIPVSGSQTGVSIADVRSPARRAALLSHLAERQWLRELAS
ncbi:MAG TPA: hypothetical protein VMK12_18075 [Anaeromyxobacteraceae bacterium]|nr:hypothetical protein [Anaeromyxobacteraceae bacterium]